MRSLASTRCLPTHDRVEVQTLAGPIVVLRYGEWRRRQRAD
jgi:hypothetical protein